MSNQFLVELPPQALLLHRKDQQLLLLQAQTCASVLLKSARMLPRLRPPERQKQLEEQLLLPPREIHLRHPVLRAEDLHSSAPLQLLLSCQVPLRQLTSSALQNLTPGREIKGLEQLQGRRSARNQHWRPFKLLPLATCLFVVLLVVVDLPRILASPAENVLLVRAGLQLLRLQRNLLVEQHRSPLPLQWLPLPSVLL